MVVLTGVVADHDEELALSDTEDEPTALHTLTVVRSLDDGPRVSMNALTGIHSRHYRTMKLWPMGPSGWVEARHAGRHRSTQDLIDTEVSEYLNLVPQHSKESALAYWWAAAKGSGARARFRMSTSSWVVSSPMSSSRWTSTRYHWVVMA